MKKAFAFVSDFDKTMTREDFYIIVIDKLLGKAGWDFFNLQKERGVLGVEFLNSIFQKMNMTEEEVLKEISLIPFDPGAKSFIEDITEQGGDFCIISAGTSYYIDKVLRQHNIKNVTVFSSPGIYENGGIKICPSQSSPYYHHGYGIDKGKVMDHILSQYEKVYFAGDSLPDVEAAVKADVVFARYRLPEYLSKRKKDYIEFDCFDDIRRSIRANDLLHFLKKDV